MKKEYRIRKNEEFTRIIRKKNSKASRSFIVYSDEKIEEHARAGISVSKKLGNAVIRNRIKRQLRMMIHETVNLDMAQRDFIVIVREAYLNGTYDENKKDLEKAIKNCNII
ncbi:MAG: ribonuclease P protein component [Erysipelotrichaceae bacterium]